jgi:hypothetical protein
VPSVARAPTSQRRSVVAETFELYDGDEKTKDEVCTLHSALTVQVARHDARIVIAAYI